jgi:hypothetical protein
LAASGGQSDTRPPFQRQEVIASAELNDWLTHKVRPMFDGRVLQITEDILLKWRLLVEEGRKTGHTFSQPDLLIAATAFITASGSLRATEVTMTRRVCPSSTPGMQRKAIS